MLVSAHCRRDTMTAHHYPIIGLIRAIDMPTEKLPQNFSLLHRGEEDLRGKSIEAIERDPKLLLHFRITERAMDVLDVFRQYPTTDEDFKVVLMLNLRTFNALASSVKLMLSGYYLFSAAILRDLLETAFLLDLFRTDAAAITTWRNADRRRRMKEFGPIKVREKLDARDGVTSMKRAKLYEQFSELAGHATMLSVAMLRPKGMDALNTPFVDPTALEAVSSEMGRIAVQVGEIAVAMARTNNEAFVLRFADTATSFVDCKGEWMDRFYGP